MFVNALTADHKYSVSNMQNLQQQFQTPLSQKQKSFSRFFILILKCAWNLELFEKKYQYSSVIIPKIIDAKWSGYLKVKIVLLQNTIR